MGRAPDRRKHVSKAAKDWSEDEGSRELPGHQQVHTSPPADYRRFRLRSRMRPAPAPSTSHSSAEEDLQPLSRLRSQSGQENALRSDRGNGTRSRRSFIRLSLVHGGRYDEASDGESEEEQEKIAPARRQSLRRSSRVAAERSIPSQEQERTPAGNVTGRSRRAAARSIKALTTKQEHQPTRMLRSQGTRATTRAKAAASQLGTSPEESSDEESEPEPIQHRSARATRQKRKASRLVQGGGGLSEDDESASELDNFLASLDEDAEVEVLSQAATSAAASDTETADTSPAARPGGTCRQPSSRQPATPTLRRLRKALEDEGVAAHTNGLWEPLEDSEPGSELPQHAPGPHGPGCHSDLGYRRYTPEEKGKQKVVEDAGPSGLQEAETPVPPAEHQTEAEVTPSPSSSGRPASKRRRLQKADGRTVKEEEDLTIGSRVRRSSRARREGPDYRALWKKKTARAKMGNADSADELVDAKDDGGSSDSHEEPAILVIDDDEEDDDGSAHDQSEAPKGAHYQSREVSGDEDVNDFIEEDAEEILDDGQPFQSPLQLAGLFDNRPDVDNCFNFYLDYLLECIADPEFPEVIRGDPRARKHYDYAIHKIEIDELARWRETYTKSDAWKRAIPGFITALERLPGCSVQPREAGAATQNRRYSSDLADEDCEGKVRECAACTRKHTRAVMQLVLKGKLGDPGYIKGAKRLKDMAIRDDDEGESGSDRESILDAEDGESRERVYDVGSHCAARVHLYHSLWHYKRRLRCQLKKELKAARLFLEGCGQPRSMADCVKHVKGKDGLYDRLRSNFKQLEQMAKEYATMQASGGFRSASGALDRVTKKVTQLMYRLNDDSDADSGIALQSDSDEEINVVSEEDGASPSGQSADESEEAALPRKASGDACRRLVLGEDADDAEDAARAEGHTTRPQASQPARALSDDPSEEVAPPTGAAALARRKAGQVIVSSSEDEQQAAVDLGRHASSARQLQQRHRRPAGQPRNMPPAKRQSGRRAEDALKLAAASFQASPHRLGQPALPPAAAPEKQAAPGALEHSSSPSRRPQPYFMASPPSRHEAASQQHASQATGEPEPRSSGPDAPGIGTDLGELLRQAQGSDAAQQLASMALPGREADSRRGPDVAGEGAGGTIERHQALAGASEEDAVQRMAREAAAASWEALAALSYPDDSPRSPVTPLAAQQHSQQGTDAEAPGLNAACLAEQATSDSGNKQEHSAAPVAAMNLDFAPAKSDRRCVPAQTPSKPQSSMSAPTSALRQTKNGGRGSKGRIDVSKSAKGSDSVSAQKGILKYFSQRSKGDGATQNV